MRKTQKSVNIIVRVIAAVVGITPSKKHGACKNRRCKNRNPRCKNLNKTHDLIFPVREKTARSKQAGENIRQSNGGETHQEKDTNTQENLSHWSPLLLLNIFAKLHAASVRRPVFPSLIQGWQNLLCKQHHQNANNKKRCGYRCDHKESANKEKNRVNHAPSSSWSLFSGAGLKPATLSISRMFWAQYQASWCVISKRPLSLIHVITEGLSFVPFVQISIWLLMPRLLCLGAGGKDRQRNPEIPLPKFDRLCRSLVSEPFGKCSDYAM